jgi:hypothetical protein
VGGPSVNPAIAGSPLQSDLLLRKEIEEMILWAHRPLQQFPKSERHVLAAEIRSTMYELLKLVITANHRYYKKTTMQDMDVHLDLLRSQVRIAHQLQYLKFKDYECWARRLAGVGNLLGGWIKWARQQGV